MNDHPHAGAGDTGAFYYPENLFGGLMERPWSPCTTPIFYQPAAHDEPEVEFAQPAGFSAVENVR
jgi:hypothetical protein